MICFPLMAIYHSEKHKQKPVDFDFTSSPVLDPDPDQWQTSWHRNWHTFSRVYAMTDHIISYHV